MVTDKLDYVCPWGTQRLDHFKEPPLGSSLWNCVPSVNILDLSFLLLRLHFCGSSFLCFFPTVFFWISYDQRAGLEVNLQSINIVGMTNCLKLLCPSWKFDMSIWLCGYLETESSGESSARDSGFSLWCLRDNISIIQLAWLQFSH